MSEFVELLTKFLDSLHKRFPENAHILSCKQTLANFAMVPMLHHQLCEAWKTLAIPYAQEIQDGDREAVAKMFDECHNQLIAGIGAGDIFRDKSVDEASKESIMSYIQALTELSLNGAAVMEAPVSQVAPQPTPPPLAKATPPPKIDIKEAINSFTTALPTVIKQINEAMKSNEDGENPLADLIKGFMNPNEAHSGLFANMAAAANSGGDDTLLESAAASSGLSVEEIQNRLKRLEKLEKAAAKKKK